MKKYEKIIKEIIENGGFDNFNGWSTKEITEYIMNNYGCSKKTAEMVAILIK